MGASGGGEKGKEVSGDTGAGLRAGNELGTTITLPLLQAHRAAAQSREQRGNDRLGWRGGRNHALLWEEVEVPKNKLGWAVRIPAFNSKSNQEMFLSVYSTPSTVGSQCCPWSCSFPSALQGNSGRMLSTDSPHPHPPLYPLPPSSHQASDHLSYCSGVPILAAFPLTFHFEPVSPLHRENRRIRETGGGDCPHPASSPVAQQGCRGIRAP